MCHTFNKVHRGFTEGSPRVHKGSHAGSHIVHTFNGFTEGSRKVHEKFTRIHVGSTYVYVKV